jgi:hypothetical protein
MDHVPAAYRVATALEAIFLRPMLAPLANACEFGDFGTGLLADELARHDACGFAALLAARLERR